MNILLLLLPFIFIGCLFAYFIFDKNRPPKFKKGDLITIPITEKWEEPNQIIKILEIGERKYLFEYTAGVLKGVKSDCLISLTDRVYEKVQ